MPRLFSYGTLQHPQASTGPVFRLRDATPGDVLALARRHVLTAVAAITLGLVLMRLPAPALPLLVILAAVGQA